MSSVVSLAKGYRRHGFNLLPIGENKRPLGAWREWQERPQTAQDLQAMPWSEALGIGALSGEVSRHRYCLDFDHVTDPALLEEVERLLGLPPDYPWSVRTPGRGAHIWVTAPLLAEHLNGKGKLIGTREGCHHVELRGRGHQTLLPGSRHPSGGIYAFAHTDALEVPSQGPADVDPELVLRVARWQEEKAATAPVEPGPVACSDHPWVQAALRGEIEKLASASEGDRNNQLNRSAMALGSLPALEIVDVVAELLPVALAVGLEERESRATIRSGFEAGRRQPRVIPERERPLSLIWSTDAAPDSESPYEDWAKLFSEEKEDEEWVYPEVLAKGRGHAVFAKHKAGKSLLTLFMAAQIATRDASCVVLYLDYEMTRDDLRERMEDMGYGPHSDLSRLRYALLPSLPPLDTEAGGERLLEMVHELQHAFAEHHLVVVIDTMSRAVVGAENDADTFRAFYTYTGMKLKKAGCTWLRLDHAGKELEKEMRGSSAKGDDVDVVWRLSQTDSGVELKRIAARMRWVPEKVVLRRSDDLEGLRFIADEESWPLGTYEAAQELEALGVPADASNRQAREALKAAGRSMANDVLRSAVRWRQRSIPLNLGNKANSANSGFGTPRGTPRPTSQPLSARLAAHPEKPAETEGRHAFGTPRHTLPGDGAQDPPYVVGGPATAPPEHPDDPDTGGDTPWRVII